MSDRVLFVDDEPNVLDAIQRTLRKQVDLHVAPNSAAGLRVLEASGPFGLVISDKRMPLMNGAQFLTQVRDRAPHTIRMILSGRASLESAVRAINEGEVYRFFLKPCSPIDLMFTIRQSLAHKRLEEQSRLLLLEYRRQASLLARVEQHSPGLLHLDIDEHGAVLLDESELAGDALDLLAEIETAMATRPWRALS